MRPALLRQLAAIAFVCGAAAAQAQSGSGWQVGAVVDLTQSSRTLALGARDQGLQLGHSDVGIGGPLGSALRAQLTATFETHEGKLEGAVEEAWLETTALPAGLQLRAGRFPAQIGQLNQQHGHADDFVERPLLYRAFFGGHWNDDGLRLNWTAPTPFYLMLGAEVFRGRRLVEEAVGDPGRPGAATLSLKLGADLGREHSWQLGVAHLRNRREAAVEEHEDHEGEGGEEHEHEHAHGHGAQFTGGRAWIVDATWKWAPGGNNRERQLRVSFEAARFTDLNRYAGAGDRHEANSIAAVWRFHPSWEAGVRTDWLRARMAHDDHFDPVLLREHALMLVWKPSHLQSLRLQLTGQRDAVGIEGAARRAVQLQYVAAFGAHGAHAF